MTLLWLLVVVYLVYTFRVIVKIFRTSYLNKNQKVWDTILVILIPFLWGLIISFLIKPTESGFIDYKGELEKERNVKYHESGAGYPGGLPPSIN